MTNNASIADTSCKSLDTLQSNNNIVAQISISLHPHSPSQSVQGKKKGILVKDKPAGKLIIKPKRIKIISVIISEIIAFFILSNLKMARRIT
jgi:hypothetical protein